MDIPDHDHDLYHRILLLISVGDRIRWKVTAGKPDLPWCYGTVTKMFPEGTGSYLGKDSAYMMVQEERDEPHVWPKPARAVHFDNPTIEKMYPLPPTDMTKLETDT